MNKLQEKVLELVRLDYELTVKYNSPECAYMLRLRYGVEIIERYVGAIQARSAIDVSKLVLTELESMQRVLISADQGFTSSEPGV